MPVNRGKRLLIEERSSCDVAVVKVRTDKGSEFTVVSAYCRRT